MAYTARHQESFLGYDGAKYRITVLQEDTAYAADGSPTGTLELDTEAVTWKYEMEEHGKIGYLPFGFRVLNSQLRIKTGNLDANRQAGTTLVQDIRNADEEDFRLKLEKDPAGGTTFTQQWLCKIRPKKTRRLISDRTEIAIIHADDGLEQLKFYGYLLAGAKQTGFGYVRGTIQQAFDTIGLGLGQKWITNWFPDDAAFDGTRDPFGTATHNASAPAQPGGWRLNRGYLYEKIREVAGGLEQFTTNRSILSYLMRAGLASEVDSETDDPPYFWDVVNEILKTWQLVLYQAEGGWFVEQILERKGTLAPHVWTYNSDGSSQTSSTTETLGLTYTDTSTSGVADSDYHAIRPIEENQLPAFQSATIRYIHDPISGELVPGNDFRDWTGGTPGGFSGLPVGWTEAAGFQGFYKVTFDTANPPAQGVRMIPDNYDPNETTYDSNGLSGGTWDSIRASGSFIYAWSPLAVSFQTSDDITFRIRCHYNLKNNYSAAHTFRAFARIGAAATSGGTITHWLQGTDGETDEVGTWVTADNATRIELERHYVISAGVNYNGLVEMERTIEATAMPSGTKFLKYELYIGVDNLKGTSQQSEKIDTLVWGPLEVFYESTGVQEDRETITVTTLTSESTIEALPEQVFYFGEGPVAGSSQSRITYGASDTDAGNITEDSGGGGSITFHKFWNYQLLKQRRLAIIVRTTEFMCTANTFEGQHHMKLGTDYYYPVRLRRDARAGIVDADYMEIREDSPTANHDEIKREWPKLPPIKGQPSGGFSSPFNNPGCLNTAAAEALYPMIEATGNKAILVNDIQDVSTEPNGALRGSGSNWTWGDNGLSKTATGTTEYIELSTDILGSVSPSRITWFNQLRRDTTSEIGVWKITAGAATVIECKILTTGVVRLSITDETSTTTNIDSTPTIGEDEWAGVAHSIVTTSSYASVYAYVLNKDNEEPYQKLQAIGNVVSLDFTDVRLFVNNQLTIRLSHLLAQAWSKSMFLAEAICARTYTVDEGVPGEEVTNPQPAMVFRTDAGIEIYDLGGTQVEDWADATNTPGGIVCRPAWHPGHSKVFYGAGEDVVSADVDGANIAVEFVGAAGEHVRAIQYSPANGKLYIAFSDGASSHSFGWLTGSPGSMSYQEFTTKDMSDFFADAADNILAYTDLSDDDVYALRLSTLVQLDTTAQANSAGVWYVRSEQNVYRMDTSGNVYRYTASNVSGFFDATEFQVVDGSGFTNPRPNTLMIEETLSLMFLVANDHIYVAPAGVSDFDDALTSASFADIATLGDVCRGASLAMINVSPALAAPVLSLGTETATTVPLTWTNISGEQSYVLQRSLTSATSGFVTVDTFAADVTSDTQAGQTPSTNSWWRIRGHNAAGAGPWSNVVAATTAAVTAQFYAAVNTASGYRIHLVADDGGLVSEINPFTGALSGYRFSTQVNVPRKPVAWHDTLDRIVLIAQNASTGTYVLAECDQDGSNPSIAFSFGTEQIGHVWALADGAVWAETAIAGNAVFRRWSIGEINSGSTWDTPGFTYASSAVRFAGPMIPTGGNESQIHRDSDGDMHTPADGTYDTAGAWDEVINEAFPVEDAYFDAAGSRIFGRVNESGQGTIRVWDTATYTDSTIRTIADNYTGTLLFVLDQVYYQDTTSAIKRCDDDGANNETFYSGVTSIYGFDYA